MIQYNAIMSPPAVEEEVLRAIKLLEALIKAHGLTRKALDQRLGKSPGYTSQVLTDRLELKVRHVLEILRALELEPGLFFRALFLTSENASRAPQRMEKFLLSLSSPAGPKPEPQPPPSTLDSDELDRRIRFAIREALCERPSQE